jgi:ABC-type multidrug transport system ATPase subunit
LKLLLGEEQPDGGKAELGVSVRAAYLPQKFIFKDEELTVLECFREDILITEGKAREYLSKFMFCGSSVFKKVRHLSGGERIRLKLGMLLYEDVNLLILDEPTNHLDIDSIETFEEALSEFRGTIFFISHDRYFINKISERIVAVENCALKSYDGNYDYYRSVKAEHIPQPPQETKTVSHKVRKPGNIDEGKKMEAERAKIETRVECLENEIREIDSAMEAEGLDYEELNKLYSRKVDLSRELDEVMELWLSLNN